MAPLLIFLLSALISFTAHADLTLWKPAHQNAYYVLPEKTSPEEYLKSVQQNSQLKAFVAHMKVSSEDQIQTIKVDPNTAPTRALLLANNMEDHSPRHPRADQFGQHFGTTFIFPIGSALRLHRYQRDAFYRELSNHFGLLVSMGGDDVSPSLYRESKTWSLETNLLRDELEAEVIRHFYFGSNRKLFGVCRGAQLTSVVLGAKLVQDNMRELNNKEDHLDGATHPINLLPTQHNVLAQILKRVGTVNVNSYHHQSLKLESLDKTVLQASALSPDGIVEAAESIDKRVLVIQSHPEKPDNSMAYRISFFSALKDWAGFSKTKSCQSLMTPH